MGACGECRRWERLPEYITTDEGLGLCSCWMQEYLLQVVKTARPSAFDIEGVLVRGCDTPDQFDCPYFEERLHG